MIINIGAFLRYASSQVRYVCSASSFLSDKSGIIVSYLNDIKAYFVCCWERTVKHFYENEDI